MPFAPFGIATVSRQAPPRLPEFLYALSRSQGADPTRGSDTGSRPGAATASRTASSASITPEGPRLLADQTGGPTDPQAGNIPGGRRDMLRGADFNDGTLQGFAVDSGIWAVQQGVLQVAAADARQDAAAVFYSDEYLPRLLRARRDDLDGQADRRAGRPTPTSSSTTSRPTDFKFAGIDVSTNKIVMGYRDASGWHVVAQGIGPRRRQGRHAATTCSSPSTARPSR